MATTTIDTRQQPVLTLKDLADSPEFVELRDTINAFSGGVKPWWHDSTMTAPTTDMVLQVMDADTNPYTNLLLANGSTAPSISFTVDEVNETFKYLIYKSSTDTWSKSTTNVEGDPGTPGVGVEDININPVDAFDTYTTVPPEPAVASTRLMLRNTFPYSGILTKIRGQFSNVGTGKFFKIKLFRPTTGTLVKCIDEAIVFLSSVDGYKEVLVNNLKGERGDIVAWTIFNGGAKINYKGLAGQEYVAVSEDTAIGATIDIGTTASASDYAFGVTFEYMTEFTFKSNVNSQIASSRYMSLRVSRENVNAYINASGGGSAETGASYVELDISGFSTISIRNVGVIKYAPATSFIYGRFKPGYSTTPNTPFAVNEDDIIDGSHDVAVPADQKYLDITVDRGTPTWQSFYNGAITIVGIKSDLSEVVLYSNVQKRGNDSLALPIVKGLRTVKDFETAVAQGGSVINLGAGTYEISAALTAPNNTVIQGVRGQTIIKLAGGATNAFTLTAANSNITFRDILFEGSTPHTPGSTLTRANIITALGSTGETGIAITGSASNIAILNCGFINMTKAGIRITQSLGTIHTGVIVEGCWGYGNYIGIHADVRGEYNRFVGNAFYKNIFGAIIDGGNNFGAGNMFNDNSCGVVLSGHTSATNDTHGSMSACSINHNLSFGIYALDVNNGYTFNGCHNFQGDIVLDNSTGIVFQGGLISAGIQVVNPRASSYNIIANNIFHHGYGDALLTGDFSKVSMHGNRFIDGVDYTRINNNN